MTFISNNYGFLDIQQKIIKITDNLSDLTSHLTQFLFFFLFFRQIFRKIILPIYAIKKTIISRIILLNLVDSTIS